MILEKNKIKPKIIWRLDSMKEWSHKSQEKNEALLDTYNVTNFEN